MGDLSYREHDPPAALAAQVLSIWELSGDCSSAAPEHLLPDGCMSLVLNFGAPVDQLLEEEAPRRQSRTMLIGEVRRPLSIQSEGRVELVGVRFRPGAVGRFLDAPVSELVDRLSDESALRSGLSRSIARSVFDAEPGDRIRELKAALYAQLGARSRTSAIVDEAVRTLEQQQGCIAIEDLAAQFSVSRRSLERRFADEVGISPKSLASVLRFRRVLEAIESRSERWAEVSAECGYYDQSHLIRDFKRFTGRTPAAFRVDDPSLSERFPDQAEPFGEAAQPG